MLYYSSPGVAGGQIKKISVCLGGLLAVHADKHVADVQDCCTHALCLLGTEAYSYQLLILVITVINAQLWTFLSVFEAHQVFWGCPDPVLAGHNPAGFSVLPKRQAFTWDPPWRKLLLPGGTEKLALDIHL